ncbi:MAG: ABC transporter permease [Rhizobiaceae bacterium]|nr:ABC transporter permease [Rhizobiaceae bacterium]
MNRRELIGKWELFLFALLVAVLVAGTLTSEYFLTTSNISIALAGAMPTAIVALAMMAVIVTGEIDISVGSIVGLCATAIGLTIERGASAEFAVLASMAVGLLAGALNGVVVAYGRVPSLVATLGTLALFRGVAQIVLEERGISNFPQWYQELGFGTVPYTPFPWSAIPFVVLFLIALFILHATYWGRGLFALGNNRTAADYSGIATRKYIFAAFVASGLACSIAAVVLTGYLASARSDTAIGLELNVITAVVLGGVSVFGGSGKLIAVVTAVFVLALVQNVLGLAGVTPERQQVVTGLVLIISLLAFAGPAKLRGWIAKVTSRTNTHTVAN